MLSYVFLVVEIHGVIVACQFIFLIFDHILPNPLMFQSYIWMKPVVYFHLKNSKENIHSFIFK
jgi:hypothetical protein